MPFIPMFSGLESSRNPRTYCLEAFLVTFLCVGRVGQVIKDIESGSPAEAAGLRNNDLVVAVNGESVEALDHDSVVEMIKKGGEQTTLLVVDKEADGIYRLVSQSSNVWIQHNQSMHILMH